MCSCNEMDKCDYHASLDSLSMMENHPESIDPPWFQELVRRAYDREAQRQLSTGIGSIEALERAMWYVFDLRNNLTELYQAGHE